MNAHVVDDIEAFALGSVDELTARRVLEHADQCPTCAVLLAEAMNAASALEPAGERPLAVPIDFRSDFRAGPALQRSSTAARSHWTRWASIAAATAALVAMGLWNLDLRSRAPVVPIASLVHSHFQHHALRGSIGNAKVIQALDGRWLYVVADGLSPNSRYELHEKIAGTERTVGGFATNASGQATAYFEQTPGRIEAFSINPLVKKDTKSELRWP